MKKLVYMLRRGLVAVVALAVIAGLAACSSGEAESVAGAAAELLGGSSSDPFRLMLRINAPPQIARI